VVTLLRPIAAPSAHLPERQAPILQHGSIDPASLRGRLPCGHMARTHSGSLSLTINNKKHYDVVLNINNIIIFIISRDKTCNQSYKSLTDQTKKYFCFWTEYPTTPYSKKCNLKPLAKP
jgi:hypothetical protein